MFSTDHYRKQVMELRHSGSEEEGRNVALHDASLETTHIHLATLEHIADALGRLPQGIGARWLLTDQDASCTLVPGLEPARAQALNSARRLRSNPST